MPPDLIATYTKDLSIELSGSKELLEIYHFFTREGGLFRAHEYLLSGGEYQYYLDVYSVGCSTLDFYIEYGSSLLDDYVHQANVVNTLLNLNMEDESKTTLIGRVAYQDFNFIESKQSISENTGKQIKSVIIGNDFRGAGLARSIYRILIEKYQYLVCDNIQSIDGGSLWASSVLSIGKIRVYDTKIKKFIDTLGKRGLGISGFAPWSCQSLTASQIVEWGRPYNQDACHHIVNIISRDDLYKD